GEAVGVRRTVRDLPDRRPGRVAVSLRGVHPDLQTFARRAVGRWVHASPVEQVFQTRVRLPASECRGRLVDFGGTGVYNSYRRSIEHTFDGRAGAEPKG